MENENVLFRRKGGDGKSVEEEGGDVTSGRTNSCVNNILSVCSVYPKKCHGNFRKHLMDEHRDRVIEIFRCD